MSDRPTPESLEEIRTRHFECDPEGDDPPWDRPYCPSCGGAWPCDISLVLAALEESERLRGEARKGLARIKDVCEEDGRSAGQADRTMAAWATEALKASEGEAGKLPR